MQVPSPDRPMPETRLRSRGLQQPAITAIPQVADQRSTESKPVWYRVWYGTNRAPMRSTDPTKGFGSTLDPQGATHYGQCWVAMPSSHQFGSLGTPPWKQWTRFQFEDDHLTVRAIRRFGDVATFLAEARAQLAALGDNKRQVLLYLPVNNLSFEQAALRSAQIGFDAKVPGLTAFFSWPSYESETGYLSDSERIAASENHIANFLTYMARVTLSKSVHILVHSTGNCELARAIQRIVIQTSVRSNLQFGHMIVAGPDGVEVSRLHGASVSRTP